MNTYMKKNHTPMLFAFAAFGIFAGLPADASVVSIPEPDSAYTAGTNLINSGPQDTVVTSLSASSFNLAFSGATVIPRAPVPVGWQTWASAPFTEGATPSVDEFQTPLSCTVCTVTLSLSNPVKTFGFETEPDPFPTNHTFDFTFFDGTSPVGAESIAFVPGGFADARLVAMTTPDQEFTSVTITGTTDFAIARFRYSDSAVDVPEPASFCLIGLGFGLLLRRRFVHSRRK